jgi:CRP-like cAMP-binding protein
LFAGIKDSELSIAAALLTPIEVDVGHVLLRQGSIADEFLVVADGLVGITRTCGNESRVLAMVSAGDVLGEMSLLNNNRRCATATTLQPTTVYAGTPREFFTLLQAVPSVKESIVEACRARVRDNTWQRDESDSIWPPSL